ncbi:MAG: UDP-N-acetylmuramate dehydrogenase, partial [Sorangiineae bacterium]|nr:UDP-N-acetylmuramate dehydrogenase [Sorangiineae bacterium]
AAARRALAVLLGSRVAFDAPLARHLPLGVGGPADALAAPASADELAALVALAAEHGLPLHVLGGGFNTVVLDGGLDGVAVRTHRLRALALDGATLRAETGVSHSQVVRLCAERGLAGLEFGAGVPGTVGGWIAMNAGVPDAEVGAVVRDVETAGPGAARRTRTRAEMGFVYRGARGLARGEVVLAARFALHPCEPGAVRAAIDRHLAHRRATQPIDQPSFGSVFVNPPGERAGRLVELAGLKGLRIGGAQISSVHANFIVNLGGATAADVLALMARAQEAVRERTGIALEPEVRIVGRAS